MLCMLSGSSPRQSTLSYRSSLLQGTLLPPLYLRPRPTSRRVERAGDLPATPSTNSLQQRRHASPYRVKPDVQRIRHTCTKKNSLGLGSGVFLFWVFFLFSFEYFCFQFWIFSFSVLGTQLQKNAIIARSSPPALLSLPLASAAVARRAKGTPLPHDAWLPRQASSWCRRSSPTP